MTDDSYQTFGVVLIFMILRFLYLFFIQEAFSLLAYNNPRDSPVGYLLDPLQRESVCAALNSAMLGKFDLGPLFGINHLLCTINLINFHLFLIFLYNTWHRYTETSYIKTFKRRLWFSGQKIYLSYLKDFNVVVSILFNRMSISCSVQSIRVVQLVQLFCIKF